MEKNLNTVTVKARKRGQVLNCKYGSAWPLGLHSAGYVKVIDPKGKAYIWADKKETLESL
jgi:hypothetical protein